MIISVDSETSGRDFNHGTKPFLITTCDDQQENEWWEWDVNPLNRKVKYPRKDKRQIKEKLLDADVIVMQNSTFDYTALNIIFEDIEDWWPWHKVFDTLYSSHLLASGQLKDLTTSASIYLGINLDPLEQTVKEVTTKIRALCKKGGKYSKWMIAKEGLSCMPSAKDSTSKKEDKIWKYDMWLPRAYAKRNELPDDAEEWTTCSDYANGDSLTTVELYKVHLRLIQERKLEKIFAARMKLLPIVQQMESKGITLNEKRLNRLYNEFDTEYEALKSKCVNIAKTYDYELEMPKGSSNNNSLRSFVFDEMKLPVIKTSKKSGEPALDKHCLESYIATIKHTKKEYHFIESLMELRRRGTALTYMDGYKKFWKEVDGEDYILFPSVNPVGTNTLRWSSSSPNSQNISNKKIGPNDLNLRYAFGPSEGREWWALDYDNLELRIPAFESGEPEMLKLFLDPTAAPYFGSYHLLVFDTLHPDKFSPFRKDGIAGCEALKKKYKDTWYQWTKNGNFAVQYGAVAESGTADLAYHVPGAQKRIEERFTEIKKLSQYWIQHADKTGIVYTMPDKEIDPNKGYPLECERTKWGKVKPTVPLSYHIQGTACWVVMCAMIEVEEYLKYLRKKTGEDHYICMNVHDEIVLDFPKKPNQGNRKKVDKVRKIMESMGDRIDVPLTCGLDYHPQTWNQSA